MSDDPLWKHPQASRRKVLRTISGATAFGTVSAVTSTTATADPGDQQWVFETSREIKSSPTVVNGTVFVGSNDGNLYALDTEMGDQQWTFETGSISSISIYKNLKRLNLGGISGIRNLYTGPTPVQSSPTVVDGTVFVGSSDGNLYAVDAETGDQQWTFETGTRVEFGGPVRYSPTVVNGTVFVSVDYRNLYAVDAETGTKEWAFETATSVGSSPTVVDGTVFIGSDGKLSAVNVKTGEEQWTFEADYGDPSSPTVVDETVFIGFEDANLYAVNAETGSEIWAFETGEDVRSSPTVVGETVFVGSDDNKLYAVDTNTGDQRWDFETSGAVGSSPTVVDETVFVGNEDGNLYGVDSETGDQQWSFEAGGAIESSPTVVDGTVFVGSSDGKLYAVDADVTGSSEDSRAKLGTLGHHDDWQYGNQSINIPWYAPHYARIRHESPLIAGLGVVGVCGYGIRRYRSNHSNNSAESEEFTTETDTSSQSTGDSATEDTTVAPDPSELRTRGTEAINEAETAQTAGEYQQAKTYYEEAITQLEYGIEATDDNETTQELETMLAETQAELQTISALRNQRESVSATLQEAERNFQEAIARYAAGDQTVARIRFRQARNAFDKALNAIADSDVEVLAPPIVVNVEKAITLPSMALKDLTHLADSTLEALSADGIESIRDLDTDTGEITPKVIAELHADDAISPDEVALLTVLSWWYDGNSYEFATKSVLSRRYDRAEYGLTQCK